MFIKDLFVISILLLIVIVRHQIHSLILQPFYWNQTTFRPYQDDSLIFEVRLGDVMDLVCPFYDEQQSYMTNELEQYDIYRVTKSEYDVCSIDHLNIESTTRLIVTCNNPYDVMKYTLNFRSYLPIPNGLEFHSNRTYYFLSTSSTHRQCNKLKIIVHDYNRASSSLSTVSYLSDQDRKTRLFSHYSHYQHGLSSAGKNVDSNDNNHHRLLPHIIKAQRHSDPYSIKWITQGPHTVRDFDKSYLTTNVMGTSVKSSHMFSLALNSSSSKLSISCTILLLLLSLK
ncbi:unnamed protein product [Rotaria magnacalcarata]|uniref:Ephrin RBD domain-containing protein n=2 Tax=Rotaria magnacalcarata TaxID=392030 RepID=A0A816VQ98_9BILA|nr:unnamed protein product [Rotaria magnacalcarata]